MRSSALRQGAQRSLARPGGPNTPRFSELSLPLLQPAGRAVSQRARPPGPGCEGLFTRRPQPGPSRARRGQGSARWGGEGLPRARGARGWREAGSSKPERPVSVSERYVNADNSQRRTLVGGVGRGGRARIATRWWQPKRNNLASGVRFPEDEIPVPAESESDLDEANRAHCGPSGSGRRWLPASAIACGVSAPCKCNKGHEPTCGPRNRVLSPIL